MLTDVAKNDPILSRRDLDTGLEMWKEEVTGTRLASDQGYTLPSHDSDLDVDEVVWPDSARSRSLNQLQVTCRQSWCCLNDKRSKLIHVHGHTGSKIAFPYREQTRTDIGQKLHFTEVESTNQVWPAPARGLAGYRRSGSPPGRPARCRIG